MVGVHFKVRNARILRPKKITAQFIDSGSAAAMSPVFELLAGGENNQRTM